MTDTWTWATVTQASPLRIRMDGEATALAITPDTLAGGLVVDDRVMVLVLGRRLTVLGRAGGAFLSGSGVASSRRLPPAQLTAPITKSPAINGITAMLPDATGKVFFNEGFSASQIGVSDDGVSFTWGKNFQGGAGIGDGFATTPTGEVLVAVKDRTTSTGTMYRSTGFNPATMDATSWATVLTGTRAGAHFDGRWCLTGRSIAPLGSLGEGALYVCEYDGDGAWESNDDGITWTQIFGLQTTLPGADHVHGIAYDRWDDRVWITVGDTAYAAIYYTNRENINGTSTPWTLLTGSDTSTYQSVTIVPLASAVVFLSDTSDSAVFRVPRVGSRGYGAPVIAFDLPGVGLIGAHASQPDDNGPAYLTFYSPSGLTPSIIATADGDHFAQVYTHTSNVTSGPGIHSVVGPDVNGYVWALINLTGSGSLLRLSTTRAPVPGQLVWFAKGNAQNFADSVWTAVALTAPEVNLLDAVDASYSAQFNPNTAGWYELNGHYAFESNTTGYRNVQWYKNESAYGGEGNILSAGSLASGYCRAPTGSTMMYLNGTTDYAELWLVQTSGGTLQNDQDIEFSAKYVGP